MKTQCRVVACGVFLLAFIALSRGDEFIVDQHNDYNPNGLVGIFMLNPIVPSTRSVDFTPSVSALDYVDFVTQPGGSASANLQVTVLHGAAVLSVSDLTQATNSAVATNRFHFYPSVPLIPGTNYTLQLRSLDGFWSVLGNGALFFAEGTVIPAQVPPPISIRVSHVDICWSSRTNTMYQVQYRSDLTTNIWVDVGAPIVGTGLVDCVTDPIAGPQKFYRVKVMQ